jgi:hypothetical protein
MNVGDPKKAAVLGVVALVIVGVAVFQVIPKGEPKMGRQAPPAAKEEESKDVLSNDSLENAAKSLSADPFAHPNLKAEVKDGGKDSVTQPSGGGDAKGAKLPKVGRRTWRPPMEWSDEYLEGTIGVDPEQQTGGNKPVNPGAPGQNAGKSQESEKKKQGFLVEAIIKVDSSKAFISIDGQAAEAFKPGDVVGTLGKITLITETEVVIDHKGKKHVLPVGRQVSF